MFGASIFSKSYWSAYLTAYNAFGDIIGHAELLNPGSGSTFQSGLLAVVTTEAIAKFSILPSNPSYILNFDNMVLDVQNKECGFLRPVPRRFLPCFSMQYYTQYYIADELKSKVQPCLIELGQSDPGVSPQFAPVNATSLPSGEHGAASVRRNGYTL